MIPTPPCPKGGGVRDVHPPYLGRKTMQLAWEYPISLTLFFDVSGTPHFLWVLDPALPSVCRVWQFLRRSRVFLSHFLLFYPIILLLNSWVQVPHWAVGLKSYSYQLTKQYTIYQSITNMSSLLVYRIIINFLELAQTLKFYPVRCLIQ